MGADQEGIVSRLTCSAQAFALDPGVIRASLLELKDIRVAVRVEGEVCPIPAALCRDAAPLRSPDHGQHRVSTGAWIVCVSA